MTTIPDKQQEEILKTVKALSTQGKKFNKKRAHLLLIGAYIALGNTCPPHWVINIQCGRTDRLFN